MALPLLRPALSLRPPASTTGRLKPCLAALPTVRKRKLGLQGLRKGIVLAQAASAAAVPVQDEPKKSPLQQWQEWWTLKSPSEEGKREEAGGIKRTKLGPLISKLLTLIAPDKSIVVLASVFMVVAALAELAIPHFATKCIFSAAEVGATDASFRGTLNLITGIVLFYGITSALRGYCFSILNNRMTMRLRSMLFANLLRRETSFFDGTEVGTLTSRLQADCQAMTKCMATNLNIAFRNMLQAVGGVIYLAFVSPTMCAATLGVCIVLWSITLVYGEYARRTQKIFMDTLACANNVADEALSLSRVVRTFGTEGKEEGRYLSWLQRLYGVGLRQATGYGIFVASGHIACYMTKVVALLLGCAMVVKGGITAEQLTNFIFYVEFVTYASLSACDETVEVMEAVGASERVLALLEAEPAAQVAGGKTLPSFSGRVDFKDVEFRYPTRPNHMALQDVSLTLEPGKLVALVGLSGSGKTTLVALLARLYDPNKGAILLDGVDLRELDSAWFRSQIGVVSQEPKLFGMSVAENIAYGSGDVPITQQDIERAAREANAHEFIMGLPQGYATVVTDKLLSGGQKQRIALARALVRKPRLLILDEATSALDAESEAQVQSALDAAMAARERTVIVIAHRLSTVRNADVTCVMDKGRIVELGTHEELLEARGLYYNLIARQQYDGRNPDALPSGMTTSSMSGSSVASGPSSSSDDHEDHDQGSSSPSASFERRHGGSSRVGSASNPPATAASISSHSLGSIHSNGHGPAGAFHGNGNGNGSGAAPAGVPFRGGGSSRGSSTSTSAGLNGNGNGNGAGKGGAAAAAVASSQATLAAAVASSSGNNGVQPVLPLLSTDSGSEEEEPPMSEVLRGMSSGDETPSGSSLTSRGVLSSGFKGVGGAGGGAVTAAGLGVDVDEHDQHLAAVAAAAAVTAENELLSKTLGSQDPIDYASSGK